MRRRDSAELLLLGALWGGSFIFMRLGAADFGPVALAFLRVAGASLVLLPLMLARGQLPALRCHWRAIAMIGVINSVLPFVLYGTAALALSAAMMSVFNATVPIWGALVAWAWLGERPDRWRALGLAIGVAGVLGLSWDRAELKAGEHGVSPALAIAACMLATLAYAVGANMTRRYLTGVPPMAVAAGSQVAAATVLALPALVTWPAVSPPATAWLGAAALAVACTGLAYALFFRLIAHAGATAAVSVTFLIPAFAMLWEWLQLAEVPTAGMLLASAVILLGTALASGAVRPPRHGHRDG